MTYVYQRWLASEFRAAGLKVVEVAGWQNRGRPASVGSFDPTEGLAIHHTGATSSVSNPASALSILITGRSDLPGPLCQYATAYDGTVYVIAAGRANVNGAVGKSGVAGWPYGYDGNRIGMGNEVMTNGTQAIPAAQEHAIAVTSRVVLDHIGRDTSRLVRHADISGSGKWDIGQYTTAALRSLVNNTGTAPTEEVDEMADYEKKLDRIETKLDRALLQGRTQTARILEELADKPDGRLTRADVRAAVERASA